MRSSAPGNLEGCIGESHVSMRSPPRFCLVPQERWQEGMHGVGTHTYSGYSSPRPSRPCSPRPRRTGRCWGYTVRSGTRPDPGCDRLWKARTVVSAPPRPSWPLGIDGAHLCGITKKGSVLSICVGCVSEALCHRCVSVQVFLEWQVFFLGSPLPY